MTVPDSTDTPADEPTESPAAPSDAELLAAHRDGDTEAFGTLFRRHRDRLWAVALRTTGNPEDAADALQEAMISAFTRADSFRGDAAVTTWLHRIVVNACLDRLRRLKVRRAEPLPEDDPAGREHPGTPLAAAGPDPLASPEAAVLAHEQRVVLLAALDRLAPEQRAAIVLVDMEGYPVQEAAEVLGCPVGTVKSRCARGRARLLEELQGTAALPETSDQQTPTHRGGARP